MFKLFRTLARGAAARAEEDLLDRHALLLLDQQVREVAAGLERTRLALSRAVAAGEAEARRLNGVVARLTDLETRAVAAIAGGREDLAREAAAAIAELEAERAALDEGRRLQDEAVAKLRRRQADVARRLAELERGRRLAAVAEELRRLRPGPATAEFATIREAEATLRRLRGKQVEAEDVEAALDEVGPAPSIAERMEAAGFGPRTRPTAESVLERLRGKAATASAAA